MKPVRQSIWSNTTLLIFFTFLFLFQPWSDHFSAQSGDIDPLLRYFVIYVAPLFVLWYAFTVIRYIEFGPEITVQRLFGHTKIPWSKVSNLRLEYHCTNGISAIFQNANSFVTFEVIEGNKEKTSRFALEEPTRLELIDYLMSHPELSVLADSLRHVSADAAAEPESDSKSTAISRRLKQTGTVRKSGITPSDKSTAVPLQGYYMLLNGIAIFAATTYFAIKLAPVEGWMPTLMFSPIFLYAVVCARNGIAGIRGEENAPRALRILLMIQTIIVVPLGYLVDAKFLVLTYGYGLTSAYLGVVLKPNQKSYSQQARRERLKARREADRNNPNPRRRKRAKQKLRP